MADLQAVEALQACHTAGAGADHSEGLTAPGSDSDVSASIDEEEDSDSGSDDYCEPGRKGGRARSSGKLSTRKRRKRPEWTRDEEETLAQLHCGVGNQWSMIASRLPNRTPNEVKNIWHSTLRSKHLKARSLLRAYATALNGRWDDETARQEAYSSALRQHGGDVPEGADVKASEAAPVLPLAAGGTKGEQMPKLDERCVTPTNAGQPLGVPTTTTPLQPPLMAESTAPGGTPALGAPQRVGRVPCASPGQRNSASSLANPRAGQGRHQLRGRNGSSSRVPELLLGLAPVKTKGTSSLSAGLHVFALNTAAVSSPVGTLPHPPSNHGSASVAAPPLQHRPGEPLQIRGHIVETGAPPPLLHGQVAAESPRPLPCMALSSVPSTLAAEASLASLAQQSQMSANVARPFDTGAARTPLSSLWPACTATLAQQQGPAAGEAQGGQQGEELMRQWLPEAHAGSGRQPAFRHPGTAELQAKPPPPSARQASATKLLPAQQQAQPTPTVQQQRHEPQPEQLPRQEQQLQKQQPSLAERQQALQQEQLVPKPEPMDEDKKEEEVRRGPPVAAPPSVEAPGAGVAGRCAGAGAGVGHGSEAMEVLGLDTWLDQMDPSIMLRDEEEAGGGGGADRWSSCGGRAVSVAAAMAAAAAAAAGGGGLGLAQPVGLDPPRLVESGEGPASGAWSYNGDASDPKLSQQPQPQQQPGCPPVPGAAPNTGLTGRETRPDQQPTQAGQRPQPPPQEQQARNAALVLVPASGTGISALPNANGAVAWPTQAQPDAWRPGAMCFHGPPPLPVAPTAQGISAQDLYAAPAAGRSAVGPSRGAGAAAAVAPRPPAGSWQPPQRATQPQTQSQPYAVGGGSGDAKLPPYASAPLYETWRQQQLQQHQQQGTRVGALRSGVHSLAGAMAMVPVQSPPHLAASFSFEGLRPYPCPQQFEQCSPQQTMYYHPHPHQHHNHVHIHPTHQQQQSHWHQQQSHWHQQQQQARQEQQHLQYHRRQSPYGQQQPLLLEHYQQNEQQEDYPLAVQVAYKQAQEQQEQKHQQQARYRREEQQEPQRGQQGQPLPQSKVASESSCMTDVVTMGFESLRDPELQWCVMDVT